MRKLLPFLLVGGLAFGGTTIVDDVFATGDSSTQDLLNNLLQVFNGRTNNIRTDAPGSLTIDMTPAGGSSEAIWAFFTKSGAPINLGIGDRLSVAVTFSTTGFLANGQDIRFGVLDSQGTRNTTNLAGGMNDGTFIGDTGYGVDFYPSGQGSPFVLGRRTVLSNANVFNSFGDFATVAGAGATDRQKLADSTLYTLRYTIERLSLTETKLTVSVTGGDLDGLNYSGTEVTSAPNTTFDYFAFRVSGTSFSTKLTFTELLVEYFPAPPSIISQPQPSALTVQVGSKVTMALGAGGSALTYQWMKDGKPVDANPSATTPTFSIVAVQKADAGSYTCVITNAGGSVTSKPVTLIVSDTPVPPPPAITTQPANTSVTLGASGSLFVRATGDNLFFQWFKNGVLIPDATGSQLNFAAAQIADSGSYYAVISNSSGSIQSATAIITVVSAMQATAFTPTGNASGICIDASLQITFDRPPRAGTSGKLTIYNSNNKAVDTIDMAANPQTRVIGGTPFVYFPILVSGNTAWITPHQPLAGGDSYYVTMDPGVVTDAAGAPFAGFSDKSLVSFSTRSGGPAPGASSLTVAADGSGDFCMVQTAIDFVPANNTSPVTITVRPGIYNEINYVPSTKPFITVRGEDRDGTVIQYANNASVNNGNQRAMFGVDATDFTLENITLWNTTVHGGSQAEAFRGNNSRILLNRVTLKSFQDTLLLQGNAMVTNSYIEGDVDFMWGVGTVFIQNSELKAVTSGGYYTQIRNTQTQNGYVFLNCKLTAADGVSGSYLARIDPMVFPYSQVVYIKTAMGPHIIPTGWLLNNATTAPNVQFWEFNSTDFSGKPLDVSQRAIFSKQITAQAAAQWSDPAFVLGGWVPNTVNTGARVASPGATINVDWTGAAKHSDKDWVGLYAAGDPDVSYLSWQYTGAATTGHMTFQMPARPGVYEFRYYLNDGFTLAATGNHIVVQ